MIGSGRFANRGPRLRGTPSKPGLHPPYPALDTGACLSTIIVKVYELRRQGKDMAKHSEKLPPLSRLELDVMDVVWTLGDCTSAQVTSAFMKKRKLAPTTIRTVLSKLREKGYLKPIPTIGRGLLLRPTVPRETVARRALRGWIGSLCKGSPRQAIAYLLDAGSITEEDLEEIDRLIDEKRKSLR